MIKIDLEKAKEIAHKKRRSARAKEFEPYDEIIAKQIPGPSKENAELARQSIRDKYATIQTQIDNTQNIDELKFIILGLL